MITFGGQRSFPMTEEMAAYSLTCDFGWLSNSRPQRTAGSTGLQRNITNCTPTACVSGLFAWQLPLALLWLPPIMQEVSGACAGDRARSSVRPLQCGLSEAAGRYGDPRNRSKSDDRACSLEGQRWFPCPRSKRSFCPCSRRLLTSLSPAFVACAAVHLRCDCASRFPVVFVSCQHCPDSACHFVGQSNCDQHLGLSFHQFRQPDPIGDSFPPQPVQP